MATLELRESTENPSEVARQHLKHSFLFGACMGLGLGVLNILTDGEDLATRLIGGLLLMPLGLGIFMVLVFVPFFWILTFVKRRHLKRFVFRKEHDELKVYQAGKGHERPLVECFLSDITAVTIEDQDASGYGLGKWLRLKYLGKDHAERTFTMPLVYFKDTEIAALQAFLSASS